MSLAWHVGVGHYRNNQRRHRSNKKKTVHKTRIRLFVVFFRFFFVSFLFRWPGEKDRSARKFINNTAKSSTNLKFRIHFLLKYGHLSLSFGGGSRSSAIRWPRSRCKLICVCVLTAVYVIRTKQKATHGSTSLFKEIVSMLYASAKCL